MNKKKKIKELKEMVRLLEETVSNRNGVIQESVSLLNEIMGFISVGANSRMTMEKYKGEVKDFTSRNTIAEVDFEESKEIWEPFNVDKWTPDRVVKTIDGKDVRILCTDRDSNYSIVGLMKHKHGEAVYVYTKEGKITDDGSGYKRDLMILKLPLDHKPHSS